MEQFLEAARDYARREQATILEAYHVDRDSPSYRFGGFVETFRKAGFQQVGEAGIRRKVYRAAL